MKHFLYTYEIKIVNSYPLEDHEKALLEERLNNAIRDLEPRDYSFSLIEYRETKHYPQDNSEDIF